MCFFAADLPGIMSWTINLIWGMIIIRITRDDPQITIDARCLQTIFMAWSRDKMWPNIRVDFLPEWPKISIQQLVVESAVKHCKDMLKRCKTYTLYTWYLPPHYHKNFHWLTIYMILHVHIHWSLTVSWNDMSLKRHNQMHGMHEMHEMQASRTFMASFLIGHWSRDFWANLFFHPHIIPTGINKGASTCGLPAPKTAKWPVVPLPSGCHRSLVHSDAVICRYGSHLCRYGLQSVPGASWCKRAWIRAMTDACFLFRPQIHKLNRNWIGGFLWRFRGFTWFYGFTLFHPLAHLHIFIFLLKHIFLGGQCLQKNTTSPRLQIPMVGLPGMTLPMVAILAMDATASQPPSNENP